MQATQIVSSKEVADLFHAAYEEAKKLDDEFISTGTLFIAMFDPKVGHTADYLREAGINREQALQALSEDDLGRADIHIRLSHAARAEGRDDAVLEHLLKAHALEPVDRDPFAELVDLLEAKERFEELTTLCGVRATP